MRSNSPMETYAFAKRMGENLSGGEVDVYKRQGFAVEWDRFRSGKNSFFPKEGILFLSKK